MSGFDVTGPLPTGVTVLEASAGTGKTYTIAALAARYVAEGTPLQQLLLVTFTRIATGELSDRVRERLVAVEAGLEAFLAGADPGRDEIVRLLTQGSLAEVRTRRDNLAKALADFDAATIATIHSFCQDALGSLGVAGDVERDLTVVEEIDDLLVEVVDDLYVRRFHWADRPQLKRKDAMQIARRVAENPSAGLEPRDAAEHTDAAMRYRLACAVRAELDRRKRHAGILEYDDLLVRLRDALCGPDGADVARRLQARHRVVLVDEFQDTDPMQWEIMRRAFASGDGTLVLIGDPKQAIYAFRGADVYAYLDAARTATAQATLATNWRSDEGLLRAYDTMFGGAKLGDEGIVYRHVSAAPPNRAPRLSGAPIDEPLRVRVLRREDVTQTRQGYASNAPAREHIARDLAADLVRLLDSGAQIERRDEAGETIERVTVCPGHVAVLVRTHKNAALVREELDRVGVPAVINGAGSVFGTLAARDWMRLLSAIERPADPRRAHTAALTPFLGWTAERVAAADDDAWEDVHQRLHHWAQVLREKGVAALMETIALVEGLPGRVLADTAGERRLTDLRHVGQLLHAAAKTEQMGTAALVTWLGARIQAAELETSDEERSRRLESDDEAVQVLTIHRSKGLEFPIVYYPFLWEPGFIPKSGPVPYHDAKSERRVDVGLTGGSFDKHRQQFIFEQRGEDLRLAYVALTRAQHQAVVWWAGSFDSRNSALGRLLFARADDGTIATHGASTPVDNDAIRRFMRLQKEADGAISLERSTLGPHERWDSTPTPGGALSAAELDRELDWDWRRTSYSDITAEAHEARVGSEPEEPVLEDEPEEPVPAAEEASGSLAEVPSLLADGPGGTRFGTFVHTVFEAADFAKPDLDRELDWQIAEAVARRPVDLGDRARVLAGLRAAIETPLGPLAGGVRLRDVPRADRLDELTFELPLAGGDTPTGTVTPRAIGDVLRRHLAPGDPLAGYADRLSDPDLRAAVRGYLTGSIDLALRLDGAFFVIDYKTNWLAAPGEPLTAWHYRPQALADEMQRSHYGLQALLYTVALHRYLRWRLAGYDPDVHLGGVLYLFIRGMTGADTPVVDGHPCGVFGWKPPSALVLELDRLLEGPS